MDDNKIPEDELHSLMDNVIQFPEQEFNLTCPNCEGADWNLMDNAQIVCSECNTSPIGIVWAFIMTDEKPNEH